MESKNDCEVNKKYADQNQCLRQGEEEEKRCVPGFKGRTLYTLTAEVYRKSDENVGIKVFWSQPPKIEEVLADSPAEKAGLQPGDYIVFIEETNVTLLDKNAIKHMIRNLPSTFFMEIFRPNLHMSRIYENETSDECDKACDQNDLIFSEEPTDTASGLPSVLVSSVETTCIDPSSRPRHEPSSLRIHAAKPMHGMSSIQPSRNPRYVTDFAAEKECKDDGPEKCNNKNSRNHNNVVVLSSAKKEEVIGQVNENHSSRERAKEGHSIQVTEQSSIYINNSKTLVQRVILNAIKYLSDDIKNQTAALQEEKEDEKTKSAYEIVENDLIIERSVFKMENELDLPSERTNKTTAINIKSYTNGIEHLPVTWKSHSSYVDVKDDDCRRNKRLPNVQISAMKRHSSLDKFLYEIDDKKATKVYGKRVAEKLGMFESHQKSTEDHIVRDRPKSFVDFKQIPDNLITSKSLNCLHVDTSTVDSAIKSDMSSAQNIIKKGHASEKFPCEKTRIAMTSSFDPLTQFRNLNFDVDVSNSADNRSRGKSSIDITDQNKLHSFGNTSDYFGRSTSKSDLKRDCSKNSACFYTSSSFSPCIVTDATSSGGLKKEDFAPTCSSVDKNDNIGHSEETNSSMTNSTLTSHNKNGCFSKNSPISPNSSMFLSEVDVNSANSKNNDPIPGNTVDNSVSDCLRAEESAFFSSGHRFSVSSQSLSDHCDNLASISYDDGGFPGGSFSREGSVNADSIVLVDDQVITIISEERGCGKIQHENYQERFIHSENVSENMNEEMVTEFRSYEVGHSSSRGKANGLDHHSQISSRGKAHALPNAVERSRSYRKRLKRRAPQPPINTETVDAASIADKNKPVVWTTEMMSEYMAQHGGETESRLGLIPTPHLHQSELSTNLKHPQPRHGTIVKSAVKNEPVVWTTERINEYMAQHGGETENRLGLIASPRLGHSEPSIDDEHLEQEDNNNNNNNNKHKAVSSAFKLNHDQEYTIDRAKRMVTNLTSGLVKLNIRGVTRSAPAVLRGRAEQGRSTDHFDKDLPGAPNSLGQTGSSVSNNDHRLEPGEIMRIGHFWRRGNNDVSRQPSPGETFENVLANKKTLEFFRVFTSQVFAEENLNFWLVVEDFKLLPADDLETEAQKIYDEYIEHQSPSEINIDPGTREEILRQISHPDHAMFEKAQRRVFHLLESDIYPRFQNADVYKKVRKILKKTNHRQ